MFGLHLVNFRDLGSLKKIIICEKVMRQGQDVLRRRFLMTSCQFKTRASTICIHDSEKNESYFWSQVFSSPKASQRFAVFN